MRPRVKRLVGISFVVVIAGLLAFNVYVLQRNQANFTATDVFKIRPRDLGLLAKQDPMTTVSTTFAAYHVMAKRLAGVHLRLPGILGAHQFALERVSRITVEIGPRRIELPGPVVQRIFDEATDVWSMEPGNLSGAVIEPGATRYVFVLRPEDVSLMVVITEDRYQRERAAADRLPPAGQTP